jgi:hypothetical protein
MNFRRLMSDMARLLPSRRAPATIGPRSQLTPAGEGHGALQAQAAGASACGAWARSCPTPPTIEVGIELKLPCILSFLEGLSLAGFRVPQEVELISQIVVQEPVPTVSLR